jgi:putative flavoprotein involved in K+ transport
MATPEAILPVAAPAAVSAWLARFEEALKAPARADWSQLFGDECYWRDFVAFTWNIITLEGRDAIAAMVREHGASIGATDF